MVAFLLCFLWQGISGWWMDRLSFHGAAGALGMLVPPFAMVVLLYRTDRFRELNPGVRMLRLFGIGFGLTLLSAALWFAVALILFAGGAAVPA